MTIEEAIAKLQTLKPHQYTDEMLVRWLSDLDRKIWYEVIRRYEDTAIEEDYDEDGELITDMPEPEAYEMEEGTGGAPDTVPDVTLIVPEPYSDMYIKYLAMQIDYWTGDISRYNNSLVVFNAAYASFVDCFNRIKTHKKDVYILI